MKDYQRAGSDAVGYLRVSSLGQVETDYNPEGISLPAQREAIAQRARELGAVLAEEFTDPGKSGKSIEHREAFGDMIAYLKANPNALPEFAKWFRKWMMKALVPALINMNAKRLAPRKSVRTSSPA